jgi:hypothetical protein
MCSIDAIASFKNKLAGVIKQKNVVDDLRPLKDIPVTAALLRKATPLS